MNLEQLANRKFLNLFDISPRSPGVTTILLYNIFAIFSIIYIWGFIFIFKFAHEDLSRYELVYLIFVYSSHLTFLVTGIMITINKVELSQAVYWMLVCHEFLFAIDLLNALIQLCSLVYLYLYYSIIFEVPYFLAANAFAFSFLVPMTGAVVTFYFFFKEIAVNRSNTSLIGSSYEVNTQVSGSSYTELNINSLPIERMVLYHPVDLVFAQTAQNAILNGSCLPSGTVVPAARGGKNWRLIGIEIVLV
jgi:hypothetical protein